jgi:HD-GYP domain-containing protein (c-di-GMP phosphodiesterase class II)
MVLIAKRTASPYVRLRAYVGEVAGQPSAGTDAVRTADVMATLCLATDLGMGFPVEHGLSATLVAARLAQRLGVDPETARDAYYGSMLFYLGCTADAEVSAELFDEGMLLTHFVPVIFGRPQETVRGILRGLGDPSAPRMVRAAQGLSRLPGAARGHRQHLAAMCEVAELLCDRLGVPGSVRALFADLPERWDGKGPRRRQGAQLPLALRIAHVARDATFQKLIGGTEHARSTTSGRSGRAFDPAVAAPVVDDPAGLLDVDDAVPVWDQVLAAEPGRPLTLVAGQVDEALSAMADFADLVSPHLTGHSRGVAELAGNAAERCGMAAADALAVRRAGMVHDLGRVAVHAGVWASTGPLSQDHLEQVRLHAYHTERVLSRSPYLSKLRDLCGHHHERLDGSGYHRGAGADTLSPSARLLAAADVVHALTEPRAHRPALRPEDAADQLRVEASEGRLDRLALDAVLGAVGRPLPAEPLPAGLTAREAEVIGLLARGLQTKQVARRLAISPKTADRHVQNAYAKIGVSTRAAAAVFAMQHGLLPWGELPMSRPAETS